MIVSTWQYLRWQMLWLRRLYFRARRKYPKTVPVLAFFLVAYLVGTPPLLGLIAISEAVGYADAVRAAVAAPPVYPPPTLGQVLSLPSVRGLILVIVIGVVLRVAVETVPVVRERLDIAPRRRPRG